MLPAGVIGRQRDVEQNGDHGGCLQCSRQGGLQGLENRVLRTVAIRGISGVHRGIKGFWRAVMTRGGSSVQR